MITKLVIENNVPGRYEHITLWIDREKYYLQPNSKIILEILKDDVSIEFLIFCSKSKKIFLNCKNDNEVYLNLSTNKYFIIFCLLSLILFFVVAFNFNVYIWFIYILILGGINIFKLSFFINLTRKN